MKRIHYISGIIITVFIVLHVSNHLYSILGVERHIEIMNSLRTVYRNVIAESILMLAVLVQIVSGIQLFRAKRSQATGFYEKLQLWSGLYLAIFFLVHLGAVFSGRWVLDVDTNIYFGVAGLNTFPFSLFFIPYYSLAIMSFFGHIASIHQQKMKGPILGISPRYQAHILLSIGVIITFLTLFGLTNGFEGLEIPLEYQL